MMVVIDKECSSVPQGCKSLAAQATAPLNFLTAIGCDPVTPPLADLLKSYHGLDGQWAVVSPIHWQASHNDALIVAAGKDLAATKEEFSARFELLRDYLTQDAMHLHQHADDLWLLRIDNKPTLKAKPVYQILHRSLMPELAELDNTHYWQKLFTESQMVFASHPEKSVINGVWIWGSGSLHVKNNSKICAQEPFYSLIKTCFPQAILYQDSVDLKSIDLLLLDDLACLSSVHQQQTQQGSHSWYWNNCAYRQGNWISRLWRKIFHAH